MTIIYPSPIFGPIHSRRLGISLGINLLPADGKCCSFDCIYCECGFNRDFVPRQKMPTRDEVSRGLEAQLQKMQAEVNNVFVHEKVVDYIIALINRTRGHGDLMRGASPRATIALTAMAKSHAYLSGRNYVVPQDVQRVFLPVITHRLILTPEAEVNGRKTSDIAKEILESAFVPKV